MDVSRPWFKDRYVLLLKVLLQLLDDVKIGFLRQNALLGDFSYLAKVIVEAKSGDFNTLFRLLLPKVIPDPGFILPLDPSRSFQTILKEKSKVFGSKQRPILVCQLCHHPFSFFFNFILLFPSLEIVELG